MDKSIFVKTFGDYPLIKLLDFLIESRDFDYPITEIAKNANVNFQTLKKLWPRLESEKIVVVTRTLGGAVLYRINTAHPVVQKLIELDNFLCGEYAGKAGKTKAIKRQHIYSSNERVESKASSRIQTLLSYPK